MAIIESHNITKTFVKTERRLASFWVNKKSFNTAVDNLSLSIEPGELVGFLGPNGAGKTTFLKILSGIMHPTSGDAKVLGFRPWERNYEYLSQIAIVMGQKNQLWWDLPAIDSFNMLQAVYSISNKDFKKNLDEMVDVLDMHHLLSKRLRNMSLGERMKCELAASLLHNPKVIFLDEPTIGLDVVSAQSIRNFLKRANEQKKYTMILTSHYMADVEALCKRVVIINHGKKIYDGDLGELKNKYAPEKIIEIYLDSITDKEKFAHLKTKKSINEGVGIIRIKKDEIGKIVNEIFALFDAEKICISDTTTEEVISKIFNQSQ